MTGRALFFKVAGDSLYTEATSWPLGVSYSRGVPTLPSQMLFPPVEHLLAKHAGWSNPIGQEKWYNPLDQAGRLGRWVGTSGIGDYAPLIGGALGSLSLNPLGAAAGAAAGNLVKQWTAPTGSNFSWGNLAGDTALGAVGGGAVKGLTNLARGGMQAVRSGSYGLSRAGLGEAFGTVAEPFTAPIGKAFNALKPLAPTMEGAKNFLGSTWFQTPLQAGLGGTLGLLAPTAAAAYIAPKLFEHGGKGVVDAVGNVAAYAVPRSRQTSYDFARSGIESLKGTGQAIGEMGQGALDWVGNKAKGFYDSATGAAGDYLRKKFPGAFNRFYGGTPPRPSQPSQGSASQPSRQPIQYDFGLPKP